VVFQAKEGWHPLGQPVVVEHDFFDCGLTDKTGTKVGSFGSAPWQSQRDSVLPRISQRGFARAEDDSGKMGYIDLDGNYVWREQ